MARIVVIADDLTGAADCAASSAALGCKATVVLYTPQHEFELPGPNTEILSIDANSRCLSAEEASERTARLVHLCDANKTTRSSYVLFKKIDSTLRGNIAAELAAMLRARKSSESGDVRLSLLMAPALPAQGRTIVGGCLLVHGVPLEETDLWRAEACTPNSKISELLAASGLVSGLIGLDVIRSDRDGLRRAILNSARHADVVICDAESDDDLRAVAEASVDQPAITAIVGSAGLASQLPRVMSMTRDLPRYPPAFASGPTLFVVGSAASASRQQARMLEAIPAVATFHSTPAALYRSPATTMQIAQSLRAGSDVLLVFDDESCWEEQFVAQGSSDLFTKCAPFLGALVATGGETARAALDALGIRRLLLLGEVDAGLPLSRPERSERPIPIITKAGAFGSPQALVRCRDFLNKLGRLPLNATEPLLHHKS